MIESSIQETVESGLNFPTAFTTLPENLVVVENIFGRKSYGVNVCGTKELEYNVMHKLEVDLIQVPNNSCAGVYTSSQIQEVP
jgi:hypothetical protein